MALSAAEPQNDRELLLKLNGEIENLSRSIMEFSQTLREIEEKKIASLDKRVDELVKWRNQLQGGWKFAVILWTILGAAISAGVIAAFKAMVK